MVWIQQFLVKVFELTHNTLILVEGLVAKLSYVFAGPYNETRLLRTSVNKLILNNLQNSSPIDPFVSYLTLE
jgi:hypothetical protein